MPLKTTKLNELALIDFRAFARACGPLGRALASKHSANHLRVHSSPLARFKRLNLRLLEIQLWKK